MLRKSTSVRGVLIQNSAFMVRMFPGDHFFINTSRCFLLRTMGDETSLLASKTK